MKGELTNMSYDFRDLEAFHGVMVFCEQRQGELMPTDFELVSEARKLADDLGTEVIGCVLGGNCDGMPHDIAGYGAAYAIQAACGMLDPTTIPDDERLIFAGTQLVTSENVDEIYEGWIEKGNPGYDYFDLSFCVDHYQDPSK